MKKEELIIIEFDYSNEEIRQFIEKIEKEAIELRLRIAFTHLD